METQPNLEPMLNNGNAMQCNAILSVVDTFSYCLVRLGGLAGQFGRGVVSTLV